MIAVQYIVQIVKAYQLYMPWIIMMIMPWVVVYTEERERLV
jgi:hypothetical protein